MVGLQRTLSKIGDNSYGKEEKEEEQEEVL